MRNVISPQLKIGQVDIANIVIDVTSRDDIPLILLGLQHIYTTKPLKKTIFKILQEVVPNKKKTGIKLQRETVSLSGPNTKDTFKSLFNLIDQLYSENEALREKNQPLKDEINSLKGEQGKPDIYKSTQQTNPSSEQDRKESDE